MTNWKDEVEKYEMETPDKQLFLGYAEDAKKQTGGRSIGDKRISKYLMCFNAIRRLTKKQVWASLKGIETLRNTVLLIEGSPYKPATKKDLIKVLGSIYNFANNGERSLSYADRELKKILSYRPKNSEKKAPKDVMSREEIRELIKYGNTLDRAIIFTMFETGCRIGEFLGMKKEDVKVTEEGADIFVRQGKTGQRNVLVVEATSYLTQWLEQHPIKSNDAFLWTSPETKRPLVGAAIAKRIRIVGEKVNAHRKKDGIPLFNKPINPHNFRHSRASEMGVMPGMTESILCAYFGWEMGSDMPRTYLHLNPEKVRKAILRTYGKAKEEDTQVVSERLCQRCSTKNPLAANYCVVCGAHMDTGKMMSNIGALQERVAKLEGMLLKKRLMESLTSKSK